jgi:hypothetical protein
MKQEFSIQAAALSIGAASGAVLWSVVDTMLVDSSALGLGVSAGIALGIASLWSTNQKKRRTWRAAEAAALSATLVR